MKDDLNDKKALKHHNDTINVTSGAWNKKNFSNDPTEVYDGITIVEDFGEPIFSSWGWLETLLMCLKKGN